MKNIFGKAASKENIYAEQAVVVKVGFHYVSVEDTMGVPGSENFKQSKKEYKPEEIGAGFVQYLQDQKIPHVVLKQETHHVTVALKRDADDADGKASYQKATAVVAGYFKEDRQHALDYESYYQRFVPNAVLKNKLLAPISPARREAMKNLARLNAS
jgi:hypothetical protein